jgi:hypothetical protein
MLILFLSLFILGLVLGVASMIAGIDRDQRRGRWIKYVNLPMAGAAATLFGLVGYPLAKYTALSALAIIGIALAAGAIGAVGMMLLIAGWAVPSAERDVEDERFLLQGHFARVTRSIQAAGQGEIVYEHEGRQHVLRAASLDGNAIAEDAEVVIERVEDGVAYVELWSTIAEQLKLPT